MDHQQEDKQPCEDQCQVEHSQTPFPATVPRVSKGEKRKACLDQVRSPYSPNLCNDGRNLSSWARKQIDAIFVHLDYKLYFF